jgi:hypothetical protein
MPALEGAPGLSDSEASKTASEPADDPELTLVVYGERFKVKRSQLVDTYDLGGLPDERRKELRAMLKEAQKLIKAVA